MSALATAVALLAAAAPMSASPRLWERVRRGLARRPAPAVVAGTSSTISTEGATGAVRSVQTAEVFLPADYPRRPPFCRMVTPVFHPNIDPQKICIGDHWSAGQSLAHLIVRIGEMLCYQSYNTKSPLNAQAAAWAEQNIQMLPLEKLDLSAGL